MQFIVLHLRTEPTDNPKIFGEIQYKFFPIFCGKNEPLTYETDEPSEALQKAIARLPNLRFSLTVQEKTSYDHITQLLIQSRTTKIRLHRFPENASPATQGPDSKR